MQAGYYVRVIGTKGSWWIRIRMQAAVSLARKLGQESPGEARRARQFSGEYARMSAAIAGARPRRCWNFERAFQRSNARAITARRCGNCSIYI